MQKLNTFLMVMMAALALSATTKAQAENKNPALFPQGTPHIGDRASCFNALTFTRYLEEQKAEYADADGFIKLQQEVLQLSRDNGQYLRKSFVEIGRRFRLLQNLLLSGDEGVQEARELFIDLFSQVRFSYAVLLQSKTDLVIAQDLAAQQAALAGPTDRAAVYQRQQQIADLEKTYENQINTFGVSWGEYFLVRGFLEGTIQKAATAEVDVVADETAGARADRIEKLKVAAVTSTKLLSYLETNQTVKWYNNLNVPAAVSLTEMKAFFEDHLEFVIAKLKHDRDEELAIRSRRHRFQVEELAQTAIAAIPPKAGGWFAKWPILDKLPIRQFLSKVANLDYDKYVVDNFVDDVEAVAATPDLDGLRLHKLIQLNQDGGSDRLLETFVRVDDFGLVANHGTLWVDLKKECKTLAEAGSPTHQAFLVQMEAAEVRGKTLGPLNVYYRANDVSRRATYLTGAAAMLATGAIYQNWDWLMAHAAALVGL